MKIGLFVLSFFLLFAFYSTSQETVTFLDITNSNVVSGVVVIDVQSKKVSISDINGKIALSKNKSYNVTHPSYFPYKISNWQNDTVVYLEPFVRDLEEVYIVANYNERLFEAIIKKYRSNLSVNYIKGNLSYTNTNWFKYNYKDDNTVDSANCTIEDDLLFEYDGKKKKSKILFAPVELNRSCTAYKLPKNSSIQVAEMPAFSKFDFSLFLNAVFTDHSFFDEIGFVHTNSSKKIDTLNKTMELKFSSIDCEKTLVVSSVDSTLISYTFQFFGKLGGYHYYYATFSNQTVQSLFEEKGYLFDYETQSHQLISIHYGNFEKDEKLTLIEPLQFSAIIKNQLTLPISDIKAGSLLFPLFERFLVGKK